MSVLTGLTSGAVEVPVEIDGNGRLVVEGVTGDTGAAGPPGPAGPSGVGATQGAGFWFASQRWTFTTSLPTQFDSIAWCSGFNLYIASGYNGSNTNRVASSADGITYTNRLSFSGSSGAIAYSPTLNRAVVGRDNGISYTDDGINWNSATIAAADWKGLTWSPSLSRFAAVIYAGTGTGQAAYSSDGITWTVVNMPTSGTVYYTNLTWASGINKFVAVPFIGALVATSSDGITWTKTAITNSQWKNVVWANAYNLLVAVSQTSPYLATSPDGTTWTNRSVPANSYEGGIVYSPEIGVILVSSSNTGLLASTDGINYGKIDVNTLSSQNVPSNLRGIAWSPEQFRFAAVSTSRATTLL